MAKLEPVTLVGTSRSAPIRLVDASILRIYMPAAWDAADIGVEECASPTGTFGPLYDDEGQQYVITTAAGRVVRVDERNFQHARWVRFYSTNSQGAARLLQVQVCLLRELVGMGN